MLPATVVIVNATEAVLDYSAATEKEWTTALRPLLEYTDSKVKAQIDRHRRNFARRNTDAWKADLKYLQSQLLVPLYTRIDATRIICRPGSLHTISPGHIAVTSRVVYPLPHIAYPFVSPQPHALYEYQQASVDRLLEARHGNVEIATGGGKTMIALHLIQRAGLRTAVVVPGKENFLTLVRECAAAFGEERVGAFGNGKKVLGRDITVCIGKSLSVLKSEAAEEREFFAGMELIIVDESHTWAVASMSAVCHGVFARVPYRFFLSATQERGELEAPLLNSIIGPRVYELTTANAVQNGFIAEHVFEIYRDVPCIPDIDTSNPLTLRRQAFLHNPHIADIIAARCLTDMRDGRASLVLIDEVVQAGLLAQRWEAHISLGEQVAFAHGETRPKRLLELHLPKNTARSMEQAISDVNRGIKLIMVGTGCVAQGTSIYTVSTVYNWVGGGASNRIKTCQGAVGRAVRKWESNPHFAEVKLAPKKRTIVVDFDVNNPQMQKHLAKRLSYYDLSGTRVTNI